MMPQDQSNPTPSAPTALPAQVATGLAKLALVFRHEAWRASGEHGLTPTQSQIVAVIAGSNAPLGVSAVAEQLAITVGTVSAAISTLVSKDLIAKHKSATDARAITLSLTAAGRAAAQAAATWPDTILASVDALPTQDQAGLVRGLVSLIRTLQERGSVPTSRMCVDCQFFRPNAHADAVRPHHCQFIDAPIGDHDLRIDCPEMEPAPPERRPQLWQAFVEGQPLTS